MNKRLVYILFCFIIIFSLILTSCTSPSSSTLTSSSTANTTSNSPSSSTTTSPVTSITSSITAKANWWDSLGEPAYGGTITVQTPSLGTNFDPISFMGLISLAYEYPFFFSWTTDPKEWSQRIGACPAEYWQGYLVEKWEWQDPSTLIMHLHQGIKWHDKTPTNGREMTADDIVYNYHRQMGTGDGFTKPNPMTISQTMFWKEPTALDKYTIQMKFKSPSYFLNWLSIVDPFPSLIVAPESVKMNDGFKWQNVTGTGAFILTDFVSESSATATKNPNYWGYDERYPKNKLPYADQMSIVSIPDSATAVAALRTGKVVFITSVLSSQTVQSIKKTNPEINLITRGPFKETILEFRCDNKPFNDIRVRKALNMAIDRKLIASTYYNNDVDEDPAGMIIPTYGKGYTLPYTEWPKDLKDEYTYNPTKAKQLLAEAGYPDGFKTNLVFATNAPTTVASAHDSGLLQIIKSMFNDIGVDMELRGMEMNAWSAFVSAGKFDQMCIGQYAQTFTPNVNLSARYSKSGTNYTHNNDATFDAIYEKLIKANSIDEAKQLIMEGDMYALSQHWAAVVTLTVTWVGYQPYLKGYPGSGVQATTNYFYWSRFWLDQPLQKSMGH
jgi:peptide/nickel transport system substrate-binding protein